MVLAAVTHHSFGKVGTTHAALRGQKQGTRTVQGEEHELHHTAKFRTTPLPAGGRPAPLSEVAGWQVKVARHTEQLIDDLPYVQILDAPVPQMVDSAMDFFRRLDLPVPEQVIDVPMISSSSCPSRAVLNEPQVVEQLVEVPTLLSVAVLQQRTAEQLAYIPVPRGRGQGFLPELSSTAISSSGKRISERTVERIVDISPGGGLGHGSSSSAGPADEDFIGVFRTFPQRKKSATRPPHSGSALPPHSSPWTPPAYDVSMGRVEEQAKRWQETQQQASEALERARLLQDQASKRRKRKKRRKRRLPKSSSHSSLRRARRRHLAVAMSGFAGYSSSCSVLLCCWQPQDARHHGRYVPHGQLCCEEAAPVVDAGLACTRLLLLVFHLALCSFSCRQAKVLGISAGMEQKDSYVAYLWPRSLSFQGSGMCVAGFPGDDLARCVPFCGGNAQDA